MQQPFRFVHAADLHIDSPFRGLREVAPEIAERLQDATFQAFRNLIDLCIREKAAFLLIAGDVYDSADRSPRAQIRFWRGLTELAEGGVQSFVVHGNHDPLDGRYSSISWPAGVRVFERDDLKPEWVTATRDGVPLASIGGVSYPTGAVRANLARDFVPPQTDGVFSIGLLHCNVGGDTSVHANYAPCSRQDLLTAGIDYWALGHIHRRQSLGDERVSIEYPGNIQGRDPGEPGPHGCLLVTAGSDGRAEKEFKALDVARWETLEVAIDGLAGMDALATGLSDALQEARDAAGPRDLICRVRLRGRGPLHAQLSPNDVEGLLDDLRQEWRAQTPWVWVERLVNETRPDLDLEARAAQDDFVGAVLRRARDTPVEELERALADVFESQYGGRRGPLSWPKPALLQRWVGEARWYLGERLAGADAEH